MTVDRVLGTEAETCQGTKRNELSEVVISDNTPEDFCTVQAAKYHHPFTGRYPTVVKPHWHGVATTLPGLL